MLASGKQEVLEIIDASLFVAEQRLHAATWQSRNLLTPVETAYVPADEGAARNVGTDLMMS